MKRKNASIQPDLFEQDEPFAGNRSPGIAAARHETRRIERLREWQGRSSDLE
jgi:hypothetical protein